MGEKVVSSQVIYRGRLVTLRVDQVIAEDGHEGTREIVEHPDAIAVVAVDDRGGILLVRQFRSAPARDLIEIPAGCIDAGEDIETAVRREMQEEIGYLPGTIQKLGACYSSPGFNTELLTFYLATDLRPSKLTAEDTDSIRVIRATVPEVRRMLRAGEFEDCKSVAGLYMYLDYLQMRGSPEVPAR